jgi:hypothetical protein
VVPSALAAVKASRDGDAENAVTYSGLSFLTKVAGKADSLVRLQL